MRSHIDCTGFLVPIILNIKIEMLQRIQNAGLRTALGAMRSTPITALHAEAHLLPTKYRLEQLAINFFLKHHLLNVDTVRSCVENWSSMLRFFPNMYGGLIPVLIKAFRWARPRLNKK